MTMLRPPTLGPIVGHTTDTSCHLWIRAADPADRNEALADDRRTIGVLCVMKGKKVVRKRCYYFRLHREYDRTGTFHLGKEQGMGDPNPSEALEPDTSYTVRMGTLALDDPLANDRSIDDDDIVQRLPPPSVWAEPIENLEQPDDWQAQFRTFPEEEKNAVSFLLGSCRYPGLLWKKKHSDRIFRPMAEHVSANPHGSVPRFVLMTGDQIYADMFNRAIPVGLADTYREFQERYQNAFGSPNVRDLLRKAPTYMILDDHEIEDNWSQDRINDRSKRVLFNVAIGAYMSYQWCHSPRNYDGRLYYRFDYGNFPFFVIDVRTQRYKDDEPGLDDNHLLGRPSYDPATEPNQLDRLCQWLSDQQVRVGDRPKFVVSPSVFVPNPVATVNNPRHQGKSDSWSAFPNTRRWLLQHMVSERIQNVVFLSGDIHCSNVAKMSFRGTKEAEQLRAFSITSSALYWPFWFADGDPANYVHDSREQGDTFVVQEAPDITMDYTASNFTQKDNFCQVDVNWREQELVNRAIDRHGKLIIESKFALGGDVDSA